MRHATTCLVCGKPGNKPFKTRYYEDYECPKCGSPRGYNYYEDPIGPDIPGSAWCWDCWKHKESVQMERHQREQTTYLCQECYDIQEQTHWLDFMLNA